MFDVDKIRGDFPILSQKVYGKPLVYLDNGATAQKPQVVIDKVNEMYLQKNANIHRAAHFLSGQCTTEYEEARALVRHFINAASDKEIIFTSGATASINLVAASYGESFVGEGDEIIVSEMEHHSNIVPWQLLCVRKNAVLKVLPFNDEGELEIEKLSALLTDRTRIVAVTQASNVLGTMPSLKDIIRVSHDAGALVLVDGCQGIVHAGVDVQALDCDFYAFSGHKLYAPTGIGVLYAKEKLLEKMPPYMGGGDMVARVSFKKTTYAELPLKFEAGTSNYIGAIALGAAVKYLNGIDMNAAHEHEHRLLKYTTDKLNAINGLRIYGNSDSKCSILSFNAEGVHPYDLGMILDKTGVAIRTGTHCAEPVMAHYGVTGMARASFAFYNTFTEADIFCNGVELALSMLK